MTNDSSETAAENGTGSGTNGASVAPVSPGPEATPRSRLTHGHVKSASISAGSGNPQSTITNREAAASASAAERDSTRWRTGLLETFHFFRMSVKRFFILPALQSKLTVNTLLLLLLL